MAGSKSSKKKSKKSSKKWKKSKKRRRHSSSSSSSSSESDSSSRMGGSPSDIWVEKISSAGGTTTTCSEQKNPPAFPSEKVSEDWLQSAGIHVTDSSGERRQQRQQNREQSREEQRRVQERELERLSWKPGVAAEEETAVSSRAGSSRDASVVGDGGCGWMLRALERARQQAAEQGGSVEEIIAERWGSMEKFNEMLRQSSGAGTSSKGRDPVSGNNRGGEERYGGSRSGRSGWRKSGTSSADGVNSSRCGYSGRSGGEREFYSRSDRTESHWRSSQSRTRERSRSHERSSQEFPGQRSRRRSRSRERSPVSLNERARSRSKSWERKSRTSPAGHYRKRDMSQEEHCGNNSLISRGADYNGSAKPHNNRTRERENGNNTHISPVRERVMPGGIQQPTSVLSTDQLNALAARAVKAELNGELAEAQQLRAQLESARARSAAAGSPSRANTGRHQQSRSREVVVMAPTGLGGVDSAGDDGQPSLRELVRRERLGVTGDVASQRRVHKHAARHRSITARRDFTLDDAYEEVAHKFERGGGGKSDADETERELKHRALKRHLAETECTRCLGNSNTARHLMAAVLEHCYMALPAGRPLVPGHCLLLPSQHASSWLQADPEAWRQQIQLRQALQRMWRARGCELVVFECARRVKSHGRQHAVLHAVPLPCTGSTDHGDSAAQLAPIYFHKALLESEAGEWNMNRSVIKLRDKSLRDSIPPQLDYFYVDFAQGSGLAHVIEDADRFPVSFGEEVLAGLLELGPEAWRRSKDQPLREQCERVNEFCRQWSDFDFTRDSVQEHGVADS